MATQNYYEILQLPRTATLEEIKKQYRKLASKFHPDKNNGDKVAEERFKEMAEAYDCLSNPQKKDAYDKMLDEFLNRHTFQSLPLPVGNQQTWRWEEILGGALIIGLAAYAFTSPPPKRKKRKR